MIFTPHDMKTKIINEGEIFEVEGIDFDDEEKN